MDFFIENSSIAAFFSRNLGMRRKVFQLEEALSNYLKPFTLIQVPDEAPEEIPRIQATTIGRHSRLSVSQAHASIETTYDNGWEKDWGKCRDYSNTTAETLRIVLRELNIDSVFYFGFSVNIFVPFPAIEDAISFLSDRFLKNSGNKNLNELSLRYVLVSDDTYYINYSISSIVKYSERPVQRPLLSLMRPAGYGVLMSIDINDRYGFNTQREYISEGRHWNQIERMMDDTISTKVSKILSTGDFA